MARRPFVLDSSALLTLIENEAGADRVEQVLRREDCVLSWMTLLEVTYISRREAGDAEADRRFALMRELGCEISWKVDEALILVAAGFKAEHKISLADAVIAAYARHHGAVLLHKDPEFEALGRLIPLEALPYKTE